MQRLEYASVYAEYLNGTFPMEAHLDAEVHCIHSPLPNRVSTDGCNAMLVVRAPKGKLASTMQMIEADKIGVAENQQWTQQYFQAFQKRNQAQFAAFQQAQRQQMARMQRQHEQFMEIIRERGERTRANIAASANARHAIAQDWCDYALDRQTVTGSPVARSFQLRLVASDSTVKEALLRVVLISASFAKESGE